MSLHKPLVSIGLPVYNGGNFIADTAASLLAQDYPNFELLISDNASTDETPQICRKIAEQDQRVRYFRNEENLGMFQNFNNLFYLSGGEYFMWSGAHDLWDSNFISACVAEFLKNPDLVLCSGLYHEIDAHGRFVKEIPVYMDTRYLNPGERLRKVMGEPGCFFGVYGLMRADALKKTGLFRHKYGSDALLIFELSLRGEFRYLPEVKMYVRTSSRNIAARDNVIRLIGARETGTGNGRIMTRFSYCQETAERLALISRADIRLREKISLTFQAVNSVKKNILKELTVYCLPPSVRSFIKQALGRPQTA